MTQSKGPLITNSRDIVRGRRVRLLIDLRDDLRAGDTGYLDKGSWEGAEWGVVFDRVKDAGLKTTVIRGMTEKGRRVKIIDVVELIEADATE